MSRSDRHWTAGPERSAFTTRSVILHCVRHLGFDDAGSRRDDHRTPTTTTPPNTK
ncbi:hypothetical protein GCM10010211_33380 [Streptomyces albospinus]|uniref:Uncharacterized protein n=1 Tax=Streptomyces albospinus TaxID=285515 RepID=A0ABQ2V4E4_9ACTN|nr:hypothetical protein GCM10010211_33380 [Streptomyces albospinus]